MGSMVLWVILHDSNVELSNDSRVVLPSMDADKDRLASDECLDRGAIFNVNQRPLANEWGANKTDWQRKHRDLVSVGLIVVVP